MGRTIAGALRHGNADAALAFLDDARNGEVVNGIPVIGRVDDYRLLVDAEFIIGFGTSHRDARRLLWQRLTEDRRAAFNVIFPGAYVDPLAALGHGVFIAANCAVLPNASIGDDCTLCVAATVDHDTTIGAHCYLSPGVNLSGGVILEEGVFVGTNATLLPTVRVGRGAVIGAGAVVTRPVRAGETVIGVPAKPLNR
jgi:sugar O-acyltransferase (sialic acid O-acetyltransferase NeuD family)